MLWSHHDQGLEYLGNPCSTTGIGLGLVLLPGLWVLVHDWGGPFTRTCPPSCGHTAAPCSVGFSVPSEPQFPAVPGAPPQHVLPFNSSQFSPQGLDPTPGTPAAEWNSAAIGLLPWNSATASLPGSPGIWIPAVGWHVLEYLSLPEPSTCCPFNHGLGFSNCSHKNQPLLLVWGFPPPFLLIPCFHP